MVSDDFLPSGNINIPEEGQVSWKAPSNIALVKYWGKYKGQVPANPSVSFTLENCHTITKLSFGRAVDKPFGDRIKVLLDGVEAPSFVPKIQTFFERIETYCPFVKDNQFVVETTNSFPHSSGIASSASGMAALALCLCEIEKMGNSDINPDDFLRKASFLARLGSGSAARSLYGGLSMWGKSELTEQSSDLFAVDYPFEVHEIFKNYHDSILIVHKGQKSVSSTVGHALMDNHAFAAQRFEQALKNLGLLTKFIAKGDIEGFIEVVENEALSLHAMMLTSHPYFILMRPNTLHILNGIKQLRESEKLPVCFTLDAGANVHLLYPGSIADQVREFVENQLSVYCENGMMIRDQVGTGPKKIAVLN